MVEVEIWTIARTGQGNAVILRPIGSNLSVPIFIGQFEAQSILIGYGDVVIPRPLTHDLLLGTIRRTGMDLIRVEVYDLRDTTFYARLILTGREYSDTSPLELDARPSDAFALAVRRKCPIFIAQKVLDRAGVPVEMFIDEATGKVRSAVRKTPKQDRPDEAPGSGIDARREVLLAELERVVTAEEYERAAEIRDALVLLDGEFGKDEPPPEDPGIKREDCP
jgi:bifunctional DNase/RNase